MEDPGFFLSRQVNLFFFPAKGEKDYPFPWMRLDGIQPAMVGIWKEWLMVQILPDKYSDNETSNNSDKNDQTGI